MKLQKLTQCKWIDSTTVLSLILLTTLGCQSEPQSIEPVSYSASQTSSQSTPTPSQQQTTAPSESSPTTSSKFKFPMASCGDKATGSNDTWYPVFIDNGNLEDIRSKYCADAVSAVREKTGTPTIQLASFTEHNRASEFAKAVDGEVSQVQTQVSISKAAQLTPAQIQQLISLDNKIKIILPTYIPAGFKVGTFKAESGDEKVGAYEYEIVYRNSSNSCFRITGDSGQWGGSPLGYQTIEAVAPALGKVVLEYTESDKQSNGPIIKFKNEPIKPKRLMGYSFSSTLYKNQNCQAAINLEEAVKVVESLQYLKP